MTSECVVVVAGNLCRCFLGQLNNDDDDDDDATASGQPAASATITSTAAGARVVPLRPPTTRHYHRRSSSSSNTATTTTTPTPPPLPPPSFSFPWDKRPVCSRFSEPSYVISLTGEVPYNPQHFLRVRPTLHHRSSASKTARTLSRDALVNSQSLHSTHWRWGRRPGRPSRRATCTRMP